MTRTNLNVPVKALLAMTRNTFFPRIERLILHVTKRCPLRCSHCFVDKDDTMDDEISVSEVAMIAKQLNPIMWLGIGGGEPFLRDDIVELCQYFDAVQIGIPTSGWFIDQTIKKAIELCKNKKKSLIINVSMDGFSYTHDRLRKYGSYDRAMETFKGLKRIKDLRVSITSTLSKLNYEELPDFIQYMQEYKPFSHNVNIMRGKPTDPRLSLPDLQEITGFVDRFLKTIEPGDYRWKGTLGSMLSQIHFHYIRGKWEVALQILEQNKQILPCLAGRAHIVIYSNGDVAPCEILPICGNIRDKSLDIIRQSETFRNSIESIRRKQCYCTHECNMLDNVLLSPKSFYKVMSLSLKK